jgi:hypothetical protein
MSSGSEGRVRRGFGPAREATSCAGSAPTSIRRSCDPWVVYRSIIGHLEIAPAVLAEEAAAVENNWWSYRRKR